MTLSLSAVARKCLTGTLLLVSAGTLTAAEIPAVKPASVGMDGQRLQRIAPRMTEFVEAGQLPGVVTLIARKGKIAHFDAIGWQDAERKLPMRTDTIFRMYSMTKPITAVAVMILFEEGRLLLEDPVSKYLPEFDNMRVYAGVDADGAMRTVPASRQITIRDLLTHTSGITYGFRPSPVADLYRQTGVIAGPGLQKLSGSARENIAKLARLPLLTQPGTAFRYGMSIDVLGCVVEVVSGQVLSKFLQERIFDPLDMHDTAYYVPSEKLPRFAVNYRKTETGGMRPLGNSSAEPYRHPPSIEFGGTGLVSTARDYLRFAQMLLDGGRLGKVKILSPKVARMVMRDQLPQGVDVGPNLFGPGHMQPGPGIGFGMAGIVVTDSNLAGVPASNGAYGWGGAASTNFWIDPEEQLVGLVFSQLVPINSYPLRSLMTVLTYQAIEEPL